jgi:hypothetical protein
MDTPPCIDLRDYGDRYRVWNELEGRRAHQADDPWDLVIPGRGGFVAPHGREHLLACTGSSITTRRVLAADPEAVVIQDGSDGQNVTFHAGHFTAVAEVLRLRRRRRQPAQAADRLRGHQFRPAAQATAGPSLAPEGVPDDSGAA